MKKGFELIAYWLDKMARLRGFKTTLGRYKIAVAKAEKLLGLVLTPFPCFPLAIGIGDMLTVVGGDSSS